MCGVYGAVAAESNDFRRNVVTRISPYLPDDLLAKLDRASMAASLEERAPFMDRALVERVCRLPIEHKMRGVATKRARRRAIADPVPPPIRSIRECFGARRCTRCSTSTWLARATTGARSGH